MRSLHRTALTCASALALAACATTSGALERETIAASPKTETPGQLALPAWAEPDAKMDRFLDELIAEMTLEEKVGQLTLLTSDWRSSFAQCCHR